MALDALLATLEQREAPVTSVTLENGNAERETDTEPRRRWLVTHPDGSVRSHSFTPPATRQE